MTNMYANGSSYLIICYEFLDIFWFMCLIFLYLIDLLLSCSTIAEKHRHMVVIIIVDITMIIPIKCDCAFE